MTRARRHVAVVCDPRTVSSLPALRDLLGRCVEQGDAEEADAAADADAAVNAADADADAESAAGGALDGVVAPIAGTAAQGVVRARTPERDGPAVE